MSVFYDVFFQNKVPYEFVDYLRLILLNPVPAFGNRVNDDGTPYVSPRSTGHTLHQYIVCLTPN